jgi:putative membrane protein
MQTKTLALCAIIAVCSSPPFAVAQSVTEPEEFAEIAASSNMFEIESSQLALQQPVSDEVQQFAQHMIDDHTAAGERMKAAAEQDGISPPDGMVEKHRAQFQELQSAGADAFEQAYVSAQVMAHDEAVALFEAFAQNGEESALRSFAAETLPTLQEHQTEADAIAGEE